MSHGTAGLISGLYFRWKSGLSSNIAQNFAKWILTNLYWWKADHMQIYMTLCTNIVLWHQYGPMAPADQDNPEKEQVDGQILDVNCNRKHIHPFILKHAVCWCYIHVCDACHHRNQSLLRKHSNKYFCIRVLYLLSCNLQICSSLLCFDGLLLGLTEWRVFIQL